MRGNRWFALSVLFGIGALVLSWVTKDATAFTAIGTTALAGGHLTNMAERKYGQARGPGEMEGQ